VSDDVTWLVPLLAAAQLALDGPAAPRDDLAR
jgi:hypothetical protein